MKAWLSERGVQYVLKDLTQDPGAIREFLEAGFLLPPVVVVDGRAVAGYRPDELAALLGEDWLSETDDEVGG